MYTAGALIDIHERTHRGFASLLEHCGGFSAEEFHRELPGFGSPTLQLQFHHGIGAERYWTGVLQGRIDADEDAPSYPTVEALQQLRVRVFEATVACLRSLSDEELSVARTMLTWGNREQILVPAQVVLRSQTHLFHHNGQIAAMCRLLGRPSPGSDFPIS